MNATTAASVSPQSCRATRRTTWSPLLLALLALLGVAVGVGRAAPAHADTIVVRVCHDLALGGKCVDVRGGADTSLVGTDTDDRITSLEVSDPNAVLTLWQHPNRQGACQSFRDQRVDDLRGSHIGDDSTTWMTFMLFDQCKDPDAPPPGPTRGAVKGGTVCRDLASTGRCTNAYSDRGTTLVGSYIGDNTITSLSVAPNQMITLFADPAGTGTCQTFGPTPSLYRVDDLRRTWIGDDQASSYGVGQRAADQCQNSGKAPRRFEICGDGRCDTILGSVPDMSTTWIGDDKLQYFRALGDSAYVSVALYSEPGYEGSCADYYPSPDARQDVRDLNGRVSSLWIGHQCGKDVRLCEDREAGGSCYSYRTDKPALRLTAAGDNRISSMHIPKGWAVTAYEHEDYLGLVDEVPNLWDRISMGSYTANEVTVNFQAPRLVPDDALSSIRIRAEQPCNARVDPVCRGGF